MSTVLLNVANIKARSLVNGPGARAVVWPQGCTIGCPGCFNPHTHSHEARSLVDPRELGIRLCAPSDIDGLTISGGEPFEQAHACLILAQAVRDRGKSIMVYSGYRYDILKASQDEFVRGFLHNIDVLVAGPYIESMPTDGSNWRGSANQEVHFLTDRLRDEAKLESGLQPVVELKVARGGMAMTGFPDQQDIAWLRGVAATSTRGSNSERENDE